MPLTIIRGEHRLSPTYNAEYRNDGWLAEREQITFVRCRQACTHACMRRMTKHRRSKKIHRRATGLPRHWLKNRSRRDGPRCVPDDGWSAAGPGTGRYRRFALHERAGPGAPSPCTAAGGDRSIPGNWCGPAIAIIIIISPSSAAATATQSMVVHSVTGPLKFSDVPAIGLHSVHVASRLRICIHHHERKKIHWPLS